MGEGACPIGGPLLAKRGSSSIKEDAVHRSISAFLVLAVSGLPASAQTRAKPTPAPPAKSAAAPAKPPAKADPIAAILDGGQLAAVSRPQGIRLPFAFDSLIVSPRSRPPLSLEPRRL
jgi:hypothetical protein